MRGRGRRGDECGRAGPVAGPVAPMEAPSRRECVRCNPPAWPGRRVDERPSPAAVPAASSCSLTSAQKRLQKMEITKTNEVELSGDSAPSTDSSSSLSPCTWRPREHRPGGAAGCGRRAAAAASAAGDGRRDSRGHKALQRPLGVPGGHSSASGSSSGSGSRSSSTDSSSTGSAPTNGPGGGGGAVRGGVPRGRGILHADGHHPPGPPPGPPPGHQPHPYRQDVEHRGRSFSLEQMWRIERENQDLLRRLRACRRLAPPSASTPVRRITASSAINRTARQKQIDRENGIIQRRLQDIQQSPSLLRLRATASASGSTSGGATAATAAQRQRSPPPPWTRAREAGKARPRAARLIGDGK